MENIRKSRLVINDERHQEEVKNAGYYTAITHRCTETMDHHEEAL